MTTIETKVIVARGVTKRFGDVVALQGCDLEVLEGECLGLLGPNGAGKSTFIGCLYGVVARTGGELSVFGLDPAVRSACDQKADWHCSARERIGRSANRCRKYAALCAIRRARTQTRSRTD